MTNVNHNPSNDFPIGSLGMDNAEDTEGHVHGRLGEADEVNHRLEEADTEGHVHGRLGEADEVNHRLEEADTEGHVVNRGLEEADTEGHAKR